MQNAYKPTLGNANRNVRGDLITKAGVVLKTQEQLQEERAALKRQHESVNRRADIKGNSLVPDKVTKKPSKRINHIPDQHFDAMSGAPEPTLMAEHVSKPPNPQVNNSRRRITETDK